MTTWRPSIGPVSSTAFWRDSRIATIERGELKAKLDRGADIRLVMSLQRWAFEAVCRYSGGRSDWEAAGYPLEGAAAG